MALLSDRLFPRIIRETREYLGIRKRVQASEPERELIWGLHGGIFYIGIRRWLYNLPMPDALPSTVKDRVRSYLLAAPESFGATVEAPIDRDHGPLGSDRGAKSLSAVAHEVLLRWLRSFIGRRARRCASMTPLADGCRSARQRTRTPDWTPPNHSKTFEDDGLRVPRSASEAASQPAFSGSALR